MILTALLSGIAYATYLYIQELNPSWERRAGLVDNYKTTFEDEKLEGIYTCSSKTGVVRLVLSKNNLFEIYLKREGADYLYAKGKWKTSIDESVFPERISYSLESEKIEGLVAEFRFRFHEMKGLFFDAQNGKPIQYYGYFPKEGTVLETWEFRRKGKDLLDVKTNKTYQGIGSNTGSQQKKSGKNNTKKANKSQKSAAPVLSIKERHEKANIVPTNIQKIKSKVQSVYDCENGYGAMTVRLVFLSGMKFEVHVLEEGEAFLYSKGVYADGQRIALNALEIKQEYAAYRLDKHPYHGTFVNDTGGEDGMKAIRKVAEIWKAKSIFETWIFSKTSAGNLLDVNDKKVFKYNKSLSKWNMAE